VTGATGKQGGAVVRRLLADGRPVRAMTRDPAQPRARRLAEQGVEVIAGNFRDAPSLARAMAGAHGVFSVQSMLADGPEQEARDGIAVADADAARAAGVAHLATPRSAERTARRASRTSRASGASSATSPRSRCQPRSCARRSSSTT